MATTTNYGFGKPVVGANEDTWGDILNLNWDSVDTVLNDLQVDVDTKASLSSTTQAFSALSVTMGGWTITESAGNLVFSSGGTARMKLDGAGNLTVTGNVTANGTV